MFTKQCYTIRYFVIRGLDLMPYGLAYCTLPNVDHGQQHAHYQFHQQIIGTPSRMYWDILLALVVFLYNKHVLEYFFSPNLYS